MLPLSDDRRRRAFSGEPDPHPPATHLEYDTWAELLIKTNHNSFGRPDADPKFGPWTRGPPRRPPGPPDARPAKSRAQVIERYRKEMLEVVRNMPEKDGEEAAPYELSLRDIVESPPAKTPATAPAGDFVKKGKKRIWRGERGGKGGFFFVRAIVPTVQALMGRRKRVSGGGAGAGKGAKVSPKPESDGRSSSNGSSNNGSGRMGACYNFLHRERRRSTDI